MNMYVSKNVKYNKNPKVLCARFLMLVSAIQANGNFGVESLFNNSFTLKTSTDESAQGSAREDTSVVGSVIDYPSGQGSGSADFDSNLEKTSPECKNLFYSVCN